MASDCIDAAKTEMIRDFLIGWRAAVLPPMTFNELGQRPLFCSQGSHSVWIHTINYFRPCQRNLLAMKADRTSVVGLTGVTLTRAGITNIAVS